MWTWKAQLNISVKNVECSTILTMNELYRYRDLHGKLLEILRENGLDRQYNSSKQGVRFFLFYQNIWKFVDNWSNFILNRDIILIKIEDLPSVYSIVEIKDKKMLKESQNIEDIYSYYKNNRHKIKRGVIFKKDKIILDVIEIPQYHYNRCVNRMVHKWNY